MLYSADMDENEKAIYQDIGAICTIQDNDLSLQVATIYYVNISIVCRHAMCGCLTAFFNWLYPSTIELH